MPRYKHVKKKAEGLSWIRKGSRADDSYSIPKIEEPAKEGSYDVRLVSDADVENYTVGMYPHGKSKA